MLKTARNLAQLQQCSSAKLYSTCNNNNDKIIFGLNYLLKLHAIRQTTKSETKKNVFGLAGNVFKFVQKKYDNKGIQFSIAPFALTNNIKKNVDGKILGLLSLMRNQRFWQNGHSNRKGKLLGLSSSLILIGGGLFYISFDNKKNEIVYKEPVSMPKTLVESTINGAGQILSFSYNYCIKKPIVYLCSSSEPSLDKAEEEKTSIFSKIVYTTVSGAGQVVYFSYNCVKTPMVYLFSSSEPNLDEAEEEKPSIFSKIVYTTVSGAGQVVYFSYNCVKTPILYLFSSSEPNLDEAEEEIRSLSWKILHATVNGAGQVLSSSYNYCIKKPVIYLFSSNEEKPSIFSKIVYTTVNGAGQVLSSFYNYCIKKPVIYLFSSNEGDTVSFRNIKKSVTTQLGSIRKMLRNFYNVSNEEKYRVSMEVLERVSSIYYYINLLNNATATTIVSVYSEQAGDLNNLIMTLLKQEDYSRVAIILAGITVVTVLLFLIAYFGLDYTGQIGNIAYCLYKQVALLRDDPEVQEKFASVVKQLKEYFPNVYWVITWTYFPYMLQLFYTVVANSGKYLRKQGE